MRLVRRRVKLLHQPALVGLEGGEHLGFGSDQVVEGAYAEGDALLFRGVWRERDPYVRRSTGRNRHQPCLLRFSFNLISNSSPLEQTHHRCNDEQFSLLASSEDVRTRKNLAAVLIDEFDTLSNVSESFGWVDKKH